MPIFQPKVNLQGGLDYHVDIVMCIDVTGSMSPIIDEVKEKALSLYPQFVAAMDEAGKSVQKLRVKVIAFRDFGVDAEPMVESRFFELDIDEESAGFSEFVNGLEAIGGGDEPENALEALALAMKSDWTREGAVRRHVIIMYTDASAVPLGEMIGKDGYPADMPASLAELQDLWEGQGMEPRAKRILLFAPEADPWINMIDWNQTFHTPSKAGTGCSEMDMDLCIKMLVKSI
ncbi:MAG: VWA domain-containing protein [Clostridia bacterium]|nr:VWA domain-containing protein [Clostridia bacterium]